MPDLTITAPENGTDTFLEMFRYVNETTNAGGFGGLFGIGLLLISFFGIFLLTKAFSYERSFVTASFVTAVLALLLRLLELINDKIFYITILLFVIGIFSVMSERSNEGLG